MNKGLYLLFDEIGNPLKSGIWNKIRGQCNAYRKAGIEMDMVYFRSRKELCLNDHPILKLPSRQLFFRRIIFRKILKICKTNSYPFTYIRYGKSDRHFIRFLNGLKGLNKSNSCVMIEFPTYPYDQEMDPKNAVERYINRQDRKWRNHLNKYVDYAASIVKQETDILGIPTFQLDNGVDTDQITVSGSKQPEGRLRIMGVANVSRWHAWDRVIRGLHEYYSNGSVAMEIIFSIVGSGSALSELRNLARELDMDAYVRFKGPLTGDALDAEFEEADLAMGSLGMHRIGLQSGSVLKIREYTARGLPSVIGYNDSTIGDQDVFVFRIPADDSPVRMEELLAFYSGLKMTRKEIRRYAEEHFDWTTVLKPVLEKIPEGIFSS